jgi:hypothetical protein
MVQRVSAMILGVKKLSPPGTLTNRHKNHTLLGIAHAEIEKRTCLLKNKRRREMNWREDESRLRGEGGVGGVAGGGQPYYVVGTPIDAW